MRTHSVPNATCPVASPASLLTLNTVSLAWRASLKLATASVLASSRIKELMKITNVLNAMCMGVLAVCQQTLISAVCVIPAW